MGRKTVIRRLAKYLPLSIEFQTASALDAMAEGGKDQHLDDIDGDFLVMADDAPQLEQQQTGIDIKDIQQSLESAKNLDELAEAADWIRSVESEEERTRLNKIYTEREAALKQ
jgi:recombination protein RecT